jgi:NAD(P)-dependent dehydrogenase (short-subunit alcohol dehydrogenase family)
MQSLLERQTIELPLFAPLRGQVAVVTGAARGLGAAIAARLASDGASVVIADLDLDAGEATAARLRTSEAPALARAVDVSDPASATDLVRWCLGELGRVDILVNNAGITGPAAPVAEYADADWRRVLSVDLDGVFYCARAVVPHMVERGSGRIVNIASISGKEGNPNMAAYSTAKAGVIGLTKALGKELATSGVLVNCIAPAVIETELLAQLTPEAVQYMVSKIPMGRVGRPEEAAALVSWLCSPECTFSTGAVFDLSGGRATY